MESNNSCCVRSALHWMLFKSHKQSSVRIEFLFQIFLFLISPFPFLAQCHMFYWWPVHWYGWLVQSVGEWPLIWAIKGLALAIWGSRHTANAFMRARISDRRVTKQSDGRICYTDYVYVMGRTIVYGIHTFWIMPQELKNWSLRRIASVKTNSRYLVGMWLISAQTKSLMILGSESKLIQIVFITIISYNRHLDLSTNKSICCETTNNREQ